MKRVTFPVAVREEVWRKFCGKKYSHKCEPRNPAPPVINVLGILTS